MAVENNYFTQFLKEDNPDRTALKTEIEQFKQNSNILELIEQKRTDLNLKAEEKKKDFVNSDFASRTVNLGENFDGDTLYEFGRLSSGDGNQEGFSFDTFETAKYDGDGVLIPYLGSVDPKDGSKRSKKFNLHRIAYGKLHGIPAHMVSQRMLNEAGAQQAEAFKKALYEGFNPDSETVTADIRQDGVGYFGRPLITVRNPRTGDIINEVMNTPENNAMFYSKYNQETYRDGVIGLFDAQRSYTESLGEGFWDSMGKGISSGIDNLQATGYGFAALIADFSGSEKLGNWFLDQYLRNIEEAQKNGTHLPGIEDIDWSNPTQVLSKLGALIGEAMPSIALMIGTGGIVGLVAKSAAKHGIKKFAADRVLSKGAQKIINKAANKGRAIGAYGSAMGMETGSIYGDVAEAGKRDWKAQLGSLAGGTIAGALEAFYPLKLMRKLGMGKAGSKTLKSSLLKNSAGQNLKNIGKELLSGGLTEGSTEGMQFIVEEVTQDLIKEGHLPDYKSEEFKLGLLNSIVAGLVPGATFSGTISTVNELNNRIGGDKAALQRNLQEVRQEANEARDEAAQGTGNVETEKILTNRVKDIEAQAETLGIDLDDTYNTSTNLQKALFLSDALNQLEIEQKALPKGERNAEVLKAKETINTALEQLNTGSAGTEAGVKSQVIQSNLQRQLAKINSRFERLKKKFPQRTERYEAEQAKQIAKAEQVAANKQAKIDSKARRVSKVGVKVLRKTITESINKIKKINAKLKDPNISERQRKRLERTRNQLGIQIDNLSKDSTGQRIAMPKADIKKIETALNSFTFKNKRVKTKTNKELTKVFSSARKVYNDYIATKDELSQEDLEDKKATLIDEYEKINAIITSLIADRENTNDPAALKELDLLIATAQQFKEDILAVFETEESSKPKPKPKKPKTKPDEQVDEEIDYSNPDEFVLPKFMWKFEKWIQSISAGVLIVHKEQDSYESGTTKISVSISSSIPYILENTGKRGTEQDFKNKAEFEKWLKLQAQIEADQNKTREIIAKIKERTKKEAAKQKVKPQETNVDETLNSLDIDILNEGVDESILGSLNKEQKEQATIRNKVKDSFNKIKTKLKNAKKSLQDVHNEIIKGTGTEDKFKGIETYLEDAKNDEFTESQYDDFVLGLVLKLKAWKKAQAMFKKRKGNYAAYVNKNTYEVYSNQKQLPEGFNFNDYWYINEKSDQLISLLELEIQYAKNIKVVIANILDNVDSKVKTQKLNAKIIANQKKIDALIAKNQGNTGNLDNIKKPVTKPKVKKTTAAEVEEIILSEDELIDEDTSTEDITKPKDKKVRAKRNKRLKAYQDRHQKLIDKLIADKKALVEIIKGSGRTGARGEPFNRVEIQDEIDALELKIKLHQAELDNLLKNEFKEKAGNHFLTKFGNTFAKLRDTVLRVTDLFRIRDIERDSFFSINENKNLNRRSILELLKKVGLEYSTTNKDGKKIRGKDFEYIRALLNQFDEFKTAFEKVNVGFDDKRDSTEGLYAKEAFKLFLDKDGNMPDEVIFAMMLSTMHYAAVNVGKSKFRPLFEIADLLYGDGKQADRLGKEEIGAWGNAGIFTKNVGKDIGLEMLDILNLQIEKDSEKEFLKNITKITEESSFRGVIIRDSGFRNTAAISLGLLAMQTARLVNPQKTKTGRNKKDSGLFRLRRGSYAVSLFDNPEMGFLNELQKKAEETGVEQFIEWNTIEINDSDLLKIFADNVENLEKIKGTQSDLSDISFVPPKNVQEKTDNSFFVLGKKIINLIRKLQNVKWIGKENELDLFNSLMNFDKDGKLVRDDEGQIVINDVLKQLIGYKNLDEQHSENRDAIEAANNEKLKDIEYIIDYYQNKDTKGLKGFYFRYKAQTQHRLRINSNTINPQRSKIMRALFNPVGSESTVTTDSDKAIFKLAVVQAFGYNIKTLEEGVNVFEQIYGNIAVREAINATPETFQNALNEVLNVTVIRNGKEVSLVDGASTHILEALNALKNYSETETFTTTIGIETDGITNGYAIGLLQFLDGTPEELKEALERVGVFVDQEDAINTYEKFIASGKDDVYQAFSRKIVEDIQELSDDERAAVEVLHGSLLEDDGSLTKFARDLAKNPVMISNYGAGVEKVINNVIGKIIPDLYDTLAKHQTAYNKATTKAERDAAVDAIIEIQERLSQSIKIKVDLAGKLVKNELYDFTFSKQRQDKITKYFQSIYADKETKIFRNALDTLLSPIKESREILTKIIEAEFFIFYSEFEKQTAEFPSGKLTNTAIRMHIAAQLADKLMPRMNSPWNDPANEQELIQLIKQVDAVAGRVVIRTKPFKNAIYNKTSKKWEWLRDENEVRIGANSATSDFATPGVSAVINMIQNMDSVVLGDLLDQKDVTKALPIYDAVISPIKDALKNAGLYNAGFLYRNLNHVMLENALEQYDKLLVNAKEFGINLNEISDDLKINSYRGKQIVAELLEIEEKLNDKELRIEKLKNKKKPTIKQTNILTAYINQVSKLRERQTKLEDEQSELSIEGLHETLVNRIQSRKDNLIALLAPKKENGFGNADNLSIKKLEALTRDKLNDLVARSWLSSQMYLPESILNPELTPKVIPKTKVKAKTKKKKATGLQGNRIKQETIDGFKGAQDAAIKLSEHKDVSPYIRKIAKLLIPLLDDTTVVSSDFDKYGRSSKRDPLTGEERSYSREDGIRPRINRENVILIYPGAGTTVLLHELIHAASQRILKTKSKNRTIRQNNAVKQMWKIREDIKKVYDKDKGNRKKISKNEELGIKYLLYGGIEKWETSQINARKRMAKGFGNPEGLRDSEALAEFLTQTLTDPDVQSYLKRQQVKNKSIWSKLVESIRNLLNLKDSELNTLLGEALSISIEGIEALKEDDQRSQGDLFDNTDKIPEIQVADIMADAKKDERIAKEKVKPESSAWESFYSNLNFAEQFFLDSQNLIENYTNEEILDFVNNPKKLTKTLNTVNTGMAEDGPDPESLAMFEFLSELQTIIENLDKSNIEIEKLDEVDRMLYDLAIVERTKLIEELTALNGESITFGLTTEGKNKQTLLQKKLKALDKHIKQILDPDIDTPLSFDVLDSIDDIVDAELERDVYSTNSLRENLTAIFDRLGLSSVDAYLNKGDQNVQEGHLKRVLTEIIAKAGILLDDTTVTLNASSVKAHGEANIGETSVDVNFNKFKPESYSEQTAQEVYVHELLHILTRFALTKDSRLRQKLERIRNEVKAEIEKEANPYELFLRKDANGKIITLTDEASEIAAAKAQYNYLFGDKVPADAVLDEFLAYSLTNKFMVEKLNTMDSKAVPLWSKEESDSVVEKILHFFTEIIERISGVLRGKTKPANLEQEIFELTKDIVAVNQSKRDELARALKIDKINGVMDKGNAIVRQFAADVASGVIKKGSDAYIAAVDKITKDGKIKGFLADVLYDSKLIAYFGSSYKDFVDNHPKVQEKLNVIFRNFKPNTLKNMSSLKADLFGGVDQDFIKLLYKSHNEVDSNRRQYKELTKEALQKVFKDYDSLTNPEKESLTKVFLKTDLSVLVESGEFTTEQVMELIQDETALDKLVLDYRKKLKINKNQHYRLQTSQLAKIMMTGKNNSYNQMLNATAIYARGKKSNRAYPKNKKDDEIRDLDIYISLLALRNKNLSNAKTEVTNVIKREFAADPTHNGIHGLINLHVSFKKESLKEGFNNNPTLMTKGYISSITDPDVSLVVEPDDEATNEEMRRRKYVFISKIDGIGTKPMNLWVIKNNPELTRTKGIVSMTSKQFKGTSLKEIFSRNQSTANAIMDNLNKFENAQTKREAKGLLSPKYTAIPVINEKFEIVDYRITMTHAMAEKHLHQELSFDEVLPTMFSQLQDKIKSEQINNEAIKLLYQYGKKNYKKNPSKFINILDEKFQKEYYQPLPKQAKYQISRFVTINKETRKEEFWVERGYLDTVFGYVNPSVSNISFFNNKPKTKRYVKVTEKLIQEMVRLAVVNIVIKIPIVPAVNFASNFVTSFLYTGDPMYLIKKWREGIVELNKYKHDSKTLKLLDIEILSNPALENDAKTQKKREILVKKINRNPVSGFVDAGLFTSITEDINQNEFTYRNKVFNRIKAKGNKLVTGKVFDVANHAYLGEHTAIFKASMHFLQMSDFIARYALYKHQVEVKGINKDQAWKTMVETFVNYDQPLNRFVGYGNDMGAILFVKYWLRIQRAGLNLIKEKPLNVGLLFATQGLLGMDIETILDSNLLTGNFMPTLGGFEKIFEEVVIPPGLEILAGEGFG